MTARSTAILLLVLLLLGGYLWLWEMRPRAGRGAAPAPSAEPLLPMPPVRVARVELVEGPRRIAAVRHEDTWVDDQGRPWPRDTVTSLLDALASLRPVMVVAHDAAQPRDYGLDGDALVLRCVDGRGEPLLTLEIGSANPAGTGVYTRLAGHHEVLLVGSLLRWEIDKLRQAAPGTQP